MYFVCLLLICHILVSTGTSTNPRSVNVNLETVLQFHPNEYSGDVQFIDGLQQFLGKVKNVIKNKASRRYRESPKAHEPETFTDFLKNVIHILKTYSNDDLEDAIAVVSDESQKYHYKGSKFHELFENNDLRRHVAGELNTVQNKKGEDIKKRFDNVLNSLENSTLDHEQGELINYINSLYGNEDAEKMNSFLNDIKAYKSNTKRVNLDLVRILRNGLRNIVFDHYSRLNGKARKELQIRVEGYFYREKEKKKKGNKNTDISFAMQNTYNFLKNSVIEYITTKNKIRMNPESEPSVVGFSAAETTTISGFVDLSTLKKNERGKRKGKKEKKNKRSKKNKDKHFIAEIEDLFSDITSEHIYKPKKHKIEEVLRQEKKNIQTYDINPKDITTDLNPVKKHKSKHHKSKTETVVNEKQVVKDKHKSREREEEYTPELEKHNKKHNKKENKREHKREHKKKHKKKHKKEHKKKHKKEPDEEPVFRRDDQPAHVFDYAAEISIRAQTDRSGSGEVWKQEDSNSFKRSIKKSKIPRIKRRNYKNDNAPNSEEGLSIDFTPVPILLSLNTEVPTKLDQVLPKTFNKNIDKVKSTTKNHNNKELKSNVKNSNEEPKITTVKLLKSKSISTSEPIDRVTYDDYLIKPYNFSVIDEAKLKSATDVKANNSIPKSKEISTSVIKTDRHNLKQKTEVNNLENYMSNSLSDAEVSVQKLKSVDVTNISYITTLPLRYFTETVKDETKNNLTTSTAKITNEKDKAKDLQNEVKTSITNKVDDNQNSMSMRKDFNYRKKAFKNVTRLTVDGIKENVHEKDDYLSDKKNPILNKE